MSALPDECCEYACREPTTWHEQKHDASDFCTRMKSYYASHGELDRLQWLHDNCDAGCSVDAMDGAATNGHLEVVKWLHEVLSVDSAAMHNSANASAKLWRIGSWSGIDSDECTTAAMDGAATNGHLNVVKWLHKNRAEGCTTSAMDEAARNGHFSVVLWLHCNRKEGCTTAAIDGAATNGYLQVVEWLHKTRSEGCTDEAMVNSASKGFLETVKYLHVNLSQAASNAAIVAAARNGHLPVVQYLHENHWERCTADPIAIAMENGHDSIVQFLLEHEGCRRAYEEGRFMLGAEGIGEASYSDVAVQTFDGDSAGEGDTTKKSPTLSADMTDATLRAELEVRLRIEVEASIRAEEEARIRVEVEAAIRAEQEEAMLRAKIRAEIQDEVEEKMRAEIRAELLAQKTAQPCTICFGKIDDPITTTCDHTFCVGCLAKWRSGGHEFCPMCRSSLE